MIPVSNLTSYPLQTQTVILPSGNTFTFTIYYVPMQAGWFITNLVYNTFELKGIRITNNPNILYQWQNILPFGLGCFTNQNREPTQQEDFSSGQSRLYVLTPEEVVEYTEYIKGGSLPA